MYDVVVRKFTFAISSPDEFLFMHATVRSFRDLYANSVYNCLRVKIAYHGPTAAGVYCDQVAGWINVPLGTEVGLSAGDFVLDDTYREASALNRVLYCGHSTQYSHLVL